MSDKHEKEYPGLPRTWVPIPASLAVYDPLPPGWQQDDHYYVYGWAATDSFLEQYHVKNQLPQAPGAFGSPVVFPLYHMQRVTGFERLSAQYAQPDTESIQKNQTYVFNDTEENKEILCVQLLAMSCTRNRDYFHQRPTHAQMDKLKAIFGEDPRWFRMYDVKKDFMRDTWL